MTTRPPVVDVVILTWDDGELLDVAVASALASEGVDVRVVVIDNGSAVPAAVVDDPRVELVRNDANRGVAPARAQGVALGTSPIVCLLDSDARLHPRTLARLVAAVEADPRVALAAPVFTDQTAEASAGRRPGLARKAARVAGLTAAYGRTRGRRGAPMDGVWDVDFAIGACQVMRREAYDAVGGLDTGIFYGPEDVDLCLRLGLGGWRVVQVAAARCDHPARRRHRRPLDRAGVAHAQAVVAHLWRHRADGLRRRPAPGPAPVPSPPSGELTGSATDVVIVAYRSGDKLAEAIESVRHEPHVASITVVDNGDGSDRDRALALGVDAVHLPANPGFGSGHNVGVARGTAPLLLLLNPDARLAPGALADGRLALAAHPDVAAVQGVVARDLDGEPERSQGHELGPVHLWGRALRLRTLLGLGPVRTAARRVGVLADHVDRVPAGEQVVESLAAVAPLVRRAAFESVGGFDERYFLYGEDVDLCRRLRRAGWRLLGLPEPWAVHVGGASAGSHSARELTWWRGTMQCAATWWPDRAWRSGLGAAAVAAAALAAAHPRSARPAWRACVTGPRADRAAVLSGARGPWAPVAPGPVAEPAVPRVAPAPAGAVVSAPAPAGA